MRKEPCAVLKSRVLNMTFPPFLNCGKRSRVQRESSVVTVEFLASVMQPVSLTNPCAERCVSRG